ncbi:MAG: hypothetical protein J5881_01435 [Clostridia bacterium]|nr:hypothetical protein [Clostridia bacterium]
MVFFCIILILFIVVLTLKIKIEIHNVNFTIHEPEKNTVCENNDGVKTKNKYSKIFKIKNNYKIKISFKVICFLQIFSTKITSEKVDKIRKKLDIKSHLKSFDKEKSLINIREVVGNFTIKEFYLKSQIGLDSIMTLTYIIPILSTIIAIILASKKVRRKNQFYQIEPIYNRRKFSKC